MSSTKGRLFSLGLNELNPVLGNYKNPGQTPFSLPEIILCIHPANERWHYNVTPSLIGRASTQNDPYIPDG